MKKLGNNILLLAILLQTFAAACTYTQKVRDGQFAYDRKQYAVAVPLLKREYNKAKTRLERGKIAYYLGASFKELNQPADAIQWFKIAYDNQFGWEALKYYALALKQNEQYEEAITAFRDLGIEIGSPYEYRKEIQACEAALAWKNKDFKQYEVEEMAFNSRNSDYAPSLYTDNQLVFTSDRGTSEGDEIYKWTNNAYSDLFVVDVDSRQVNSFDNQLNTPNNEGSAAFNANYSEIYFSQCNGGKKADIYCKLVVSRKIGNGWSVPEVLPFVKDEINYGQATLSKDGRTMYFECNDPEGWGGKDIWVVQRQGETWGEPRLLGRSINTEGNERFPYLDSDTLYFSSDRHIGMGGLDIFKSHRVNDRWTVAENLNAPINSGGDDFGYVIDYQTARESEDIIYTGYFTSSRQGGKGADDIYHFSKKVPPPPPPVDPTIEKPPVVYKMILDGYILEKIYEVPNDPSSQVQGRKPLEGAQVEVVLKNGEKKQFEVGEDGYFSFELAEDMAYDFFTSKDNYLNDASNFSTADVAKDPDNPVRRFELEIVLDKIFRDKEIVLENIYYDFDRWEIREDAKPTLNELIETLSLNPELRIELSSHTDCRGGDNYNKTLSQRRAQSAVDYLIANNIEAERLIAKGYGEDDPRANCNCSRCSEDEHQQNRRTGFRIIEN
ncbi:MAG: OmpA family protein [Bacteroidota bacterium]